MSRQPAPRSLTLVSVLLLIACLAGCGGGQTSSLHIFVQDAQSAVNAATRITLKEAADEVSSAYSKAAKLSPGSSADLGRQQQGLKLLEEANATMSSLENASEQGSTGSVLGLRGELQARAKALSSLQQSLEAAQ
jgi:Tfp pilus assembly protein PilP